MNKVIAAALEEGIENYEGGFNTTEVVDTAGKMIDIQKIMGFKHNIPMDDILSIEAVLDDYINAMRAAAYEVGFKDGFNLVLDMKKTSN